jgi:transcriptional regulator with XRE-family HTH domain
MDVETQKRELAGLVRQSRRSQGLTQADLAVRVGITKGALSRYESGDLRVLGDTTLRAVCEALQVVGPAWLDAVVAAPERQAGGLVRYYCPTPFCPLNEVYLTLTEVRFVPRQVESYAEAAVLCRYCGADMLSECRDCGSALVAGSVICTDCGGAYVPPSPLDAAAMRVLEFSPPPVAKLSRPAIGVPFWQPRAPGASAGDAVSDGGTGRQVKSGGRSHGGAA